MNTSPFRFPRFTVGLVLLLLLALWLPNPCDALSQTALKGFSGTSTSWTNAGDGVVNYYVASASSQNPGPATVRFLSATGNYTANKITFYWATATTNTWNLLTNSAVAGQTTNFWTGSDASSVASNSLVVIRHVSADTYERGRVYSSSTTNICVQAAIGTAPTPGDMIYLETAQGTIPVGNATITYYGGPLLYGQPGKPFYIELSGTNATLNCVAGDYMP